jgi:serine/threonine protein kinase/tetratricopeptide (TPR) repeat protein
MDYRQRRIKEIFSDAVELKEPERSEFLLRVCEDGELRAEVEKLLSSFSQQDGVLKSSVGSLLFGGEDNPSTLNEGDVIDGRFRIIRLIGRGGMGEVYEAEDAERGESVAIKTLRWQYILSPQLHARFQREIQLASKISHENVCEIYHFGSDRIRDTDVAYVTMKLLRGVTLAHRIEQGPMSVAEVKVIVEQVAGGLCALHEHGIIHRDLKPANIILTESEDGVRAIITDFGLAQSFKAENRDQTLTHTGQLLGTPSYMAPEQLTGGTSGPETDIYALGVVMYQMLSGHRPFEAENMFEVAAQKLAMKPEPLSTYIDISRDWERLIARCLERDRAARFQTASEFLAQVRVLSLRKRRWSGMRRWRSLKRSKRWSLLSVSELRKRPLLVSSVAAALTVMIAPMLIPAVRATALRRGCTAFPGSRLLCQLPDDRGIAVLPFKVTGSSPDQQAVARGAAHYIRESFARLAPDPEKICVHLRTDNLAEGVGLVLEGTVHSAPEGIRVRLIVRESRPVDGSRDPLVLRTIERVYDRSRTRRLGPDTLSAIARAVGLRFPQKEWDAWSRSVPRNSDTVIAYLSGLGLLNTGSYEQAARAFNQVIDPERSFDFAPAHVGLGDAYRLLFNRTKEPGWAQRARLAYQRAIPLDRDFGFAGAERSLGELEIAAAQPETAIQRYRAALKLWPYDQPTQKRLVNVLESRGRVNEAVTVLQDAVKLTPRCWLSHNALASMYSRHGRLRDSEASMLEVVRLAPYNATAYHNLAFDYLKAGRYDDAVEMSSKAVTFGPSSLGYSTLGRGYLGKGCTQDALLNLRAAADAEPESFIVWANLAEALYRIQPESSNAAAANVRTIELSRKSLESTPDYPLAAAQCGLNLARAQRRPEAIPHLIRARNDGSLDSTILLTTAQGFYLLSEREKAYEALKAALQRGATPPEIRARTGLKPLIDDAKAAGIVTGNAVNDRIDAGGLVTQRPAGCPGWTEPGKGLRVN